VVRAAIVGICLFVSAATARPQEPPPPPPDPQDAADVEASLGPALEEQIGPRPGAPTVGLKQAVALALERNFGILNSADVVSVGRMREALSRNQFLPKLTPQFQRTPDDHRFGLAASQRIPWSGASLTASAGFRDDVEVEGPFGRTTDVQVFLTQPLLRGFGPNATFFELRNSRRARESTERQHELARQRLIVEVTRSFYEVAQQRQLLVVSRQSLKRSHSLLQASEARLKVGLSSKLDVFRAELQASQAQESMVRAEATLEGALERFRTLLGLTPTDTLEPEAHLLADTSAADPVEPLEVLAARAVENRLDLQENRDLVEDARRTASLAKQNLLPQLDLGLGFSQVGSGPGFGSAFRAGDPRFNVFLTTSYPLDRSSEATNRAVAQLDVGSRRRTLQQKEIDVQAEVRTAVRELERIRKSIELQRKAVEVAEQQRRLATLRYQRGLAPNFDVVDAEGSLVLARSALVNLLAAYHVARVELKRLTGELDPEEYLS
jgi:outer membrane protein